jgi:hypothetical protein
MMMTKPDTDMLETLFQDARATPPAMPDGLMDRIMADAVAQQPKAKSGGWRAIWQAIGGAPAFGGLVTATAVGFWIGVAPPSNLPDIATQIITGTEYASFDDTSLPDFSAFGWDIEEG